MAKIEQITIVGLGLIGGSLAMALKKRRLPLEIVGTGRRASTLRKALKKKAIDRAVASHRAAVAGSDIVFICAPISRIIPLIKEIKPGLKPGAVVTDVGSTKSEIVKRAEKILRGSARFVGGHPMAGTERTGIDSAMPDLFKGRTWILTPTRNTNAGALKTVENLLKKIGVKVLKLSPEQQDLLVAGISHLPLVVAASLARSIASRKERRSFASVASSGFRDTTRVASGDPALGADIFATNGKAILKMISSFKSSLGKLESIIRKGNTAEASSFLKAAKKFRDGIGREK